MQGSEFKTRVIPLSNKLLRFAGCFLNNGEDARDAVQDVLLKLWEKRDTLDTVNNLGAYAMQVTRNLCLDRIRASRSMSENLPGELTLAGKTEELPDRSEWEDTAGWLLKLMNRLPEQQKSVIFLRDVEQMEYDQIAAITGLELNNLRVTLSRARKQVRDELIKLWKNEERRDRQIAG